jgi:hypothetical protein
MTRRTIERIIMIAMVLFIACTIVSFSYSQDLGERRPYYTEILTLFPYFPYYVWAEDTNNKKIDVKIHEMGAEVKFLIRM